MSLADALSAVEQTEAGENRTLVVRGTLHV